MYAGIDAVTSPMTSGPAIIATRDTTAYGVQATRYATVITPKSITIFRSISRAFFVKGDFFPHVFFARFAPLFISRHDL